MKYCNIRLDQYELNILKSLVKAEYNREQIRFENKYTDDFDKDIAKDNMIRLLTIGGKLNNAILMSDGEVDWEMKIWVDDFREAPEGYERVHTTNQAIDYIKVYGKFVTLLDLDHDAGLYAQFGGDYVKILDYMEQEGIDYIPIKIHSQNPVGVENMRRIIERNGWEEVE